MSTNSFNSKRHRADVGQNFVDLSDSYANSGMRIGFLHEPTGEQVYFKAFVTAYNETWASDYSSESVFGRIDPIHMFKQTVRNITLSFVAPASTVSEGYDNMNRLNRLRAFLYPTYVNHNNALTINQTPLVRMTVMNMLVSQGDGGYSTKSYNEMFNVSDTAPSPIDAAYGALGIISSLNVNYNIDSPDVGVFQNNGGGIILPKTLEISVEFKVIHEKNVGWVEGVTENIFGLEDPFGGSTGTWGESQQAYNPNDEVPPGSTEYNDDLEAYNAGTDPDFLVSDTDEFPTSETDFEEGSFDTIDDEYAISETGEECSDDEISAANLDILEGDYDVSY